jgi:penicillin-binding protein 1A
MSVRQKISQLLDRVPVYGYLRVRWRAFRMRKPGWARLIRILSYLVGLFYVVKIIFVLGFFGHIPTVNQLEKLNMENASSLYSADGQLLGRYYKRNRTSTTFDQLPKHLVQALVATEDSRFYSHGGVDWMAFGRVFFKTVIGGDESSGGGSTLSQQVAKNLFPRQQFPFLSTPISKFREMLIARRLERAYTKEEILTVYLNTVPFPDNVFGIEVASRRFFSVKPKELSVIQAATLVGTLKASTIYNPRRFPERSKERRNLVLGLMAENNYLTPELAKDLKADSLVLNYSTDYMLNEGKASHFREYLRIKVLPELLDSIQKSTGIAYDLYKDGLKIYTTLDSRMQAHAELAVDTRMRDLQQTFDNHWAGQLPWHNDTILMDAYKQTPAYYAIRYETEEKIKKIINKKQPMTLFTYKGDKDVIMSSIDSFKYYFALLNSGLLAMEPQTGAIKAWVGGYDFNYNQYDQVRANRQVGSSFKPLVYATALEKGISPCEPIPNKRVIWHKYEDDWAVKDPSRKDPKPNKDPKTHKDLDDWSPENVDKRYGGYYSMEGALTHSVNTASVATIFRVGVPAVVKTCKLLGIESKVPAEPSIALGAAELTLLDMVTAFSAFPNRGIKTKPVYITRIEKADGTVIYDQAKLVKKPMRALKTETADAMCRMLQSVVDDGGTAGSLRWKYNINGDVAGKTGTSQNHSDGWFIGFMPNLVAGSYVGAPSPAVRFRDIKYGQGSSTALPIWGLFMQKVLADTAFSHLTKDVFSMPAKWMLDSLECTQRPWPKTTWTSGDSTDMVLMVDDTGQTVFADSTKVNLPILPDLNELDPANKAKSDNEKPKSDGGEKQAPDKPKQLLKPVPEKKN